MSTTVVCVSCSIEQEIPDPAPGCRAVGRCPMCDGLMFEPVAQSALFERNVTHTREDF